jgi:diguanylate cyclase (GGDEF)-like protein
MPSQAPSLRTTFRAFVWTAIVIAGLVLVGGWVCGVVALRNVVPGTVGMKAWTAIGLLSAAISLLALTRRPARAGALVARGGAAFVALLGLAVLAEYVLRVNLAIDELLFYDASGHAAQIAFPGRFAPTTATCFVLLGCALLTIDVAPRRGWRIAELLTIPVAAIGAMTLVGYLYAIPVFYGPSAAAKMALNTGICFLALSGAVTLARPRGRLVALATTDDPGGVMVRRLLPLAIIVPLLLGWAKLAGSDAGWFGDRVGTWLVSATTIIALCLLVYRVAGRLSQSARQRDVLEAELHRLASHDSLTGLLNRRRFDEELAAAAARVARHGEACSLLVLDLDRMKVVNDTLGHAAGDALLARVGALLRARTRTGDAGARVGGDEFALLLAGADLEHARVLAEELVQTIALCRVPAEHGAAWTTASVGVAPIAAPDALGEAAMVQADRAMYDAKRRGGDGVVVAGADVRGGPAPPGAPPAGGSAPPPARGSAPPRFARVP